METLKTTLEPEAVAAQTTAEEIRKRIEELEGDLYYMNRRSPFVDFGNDAVTRESQKIGDEIYRLRDLLPHATPIRDGEPIHYGDDNNPFIGC